MSLITYYAPYRNYPIIALPDVPRLYDIIYLAFFVNVHSRPVDTFVASQIPAPLLKQWTKECVERGQRIGISLIDSPQEGCGWNNCDLSVFVPALVAVVREWQFTDINLDGDGDYIDFFTKLAPAIKAALPTTPISAVFADGCGPLIQTLSPYVDGIYTMIYGDDFDEHVELLQYNAQYIDKRKIFAGVKINPDLQTSLKTTFQLGQWLQKNGYGGIMTWSCESDENNITGADDNIWCITAYTSLHRPHLPALEHACKMTMPNGENTFCKKCCRCFNRLWR